MELCNDQAMDRCIPCETLIVLKSQSTLGVEFGQLPETCKRAFTAGAGAGLSGLSPSLTGQHWERGQIQDGVPMSLVPLGPVEGWF